MSYFFVLCFGLQLHNVTLALDLLDDIGLQLPNIDPQGEENDATFQRSKKHNHNTYWPGGRKIYCL